MTKIVETYQREIELLVDLFCEGKITVEHMILVWHLMQISAEE